MKKLLSNNHANMGTIVLAITTAITIAVSIVIIYSIIGGLSANSTSIDARLPGSPAGNATTSLIAGLSTFYTISPIYLIVLVAVAIIGAVMGIMYVGNKE